MLSSREMQARGESVAPDSLVAEVQIALFFETLVEMYAGVFRDLKRRPAPPLIRVDFCPFANADSFVRLTGDGIHVRVTDLLEGAPAPVAEALAYILLGKLFRRPVPPIYAHRYRLYLNRRDTPRPIHLARPLRAPKFISEPPH